MGTGYFNLHPARRALASIDRDCINLLGSQQGASCARILGALEVKKTAPTQNSHPGFGPTSVQPTCLLLTSKMFLVVSPQTMCRLGNILVKTNNTNQNAALSMG